jgi:photosystem II stability/assembly factor-like uncharacterized protein
MMSCHAGGPAPAQNVPLEDAGNRWEQRPPPASDRGLANPEISFLDDHEGWLLTTGSPATQCQSQVTAIWHTTDARAMWQLVSAIGVAEAQCKSSRSFVDQTHGFLAAWDQSHAPVIYRTADAGRTWSASRPMPDLCLFSPGWPRSTGGAVPSHASTEDPASRAPTFARSTRPAGQ